MSNYTEKVPELRKKFLDKHYSSEKNYYDTRDISRVKSDDQFVLQFLNGVKEGNVDKAHKVMIEGLKWRKSFGINDLKEKDIHEDVLKSGVVYMNGKDKKGASILLHLIENYTWKGNKEKTESFNKLYAFYFEKHYREHPGEKLTVVTQCLGTGLANTDIDTSKFIVHLLTYVYPDILENVFVLNFPKIFSPLWKITKALLSATLVKKYIFPKNDEIFQYVDKDQLPPSCGGENTFVYKYPLDEKTTADSNSNVAETDLVA